MTVEEREEDDEEDLRGKLVDDYDKESQKSRSPCQYVWFTSSSLLEINLGYFVTRLVFFLKKIKNSSEWILRRKRREQEIK